MMKLQRYFQRIGFNGESTPDLATLKALHQAHATSTPFENIDVQLERPLTTDIDAAFDKIVTRGRGGWCYEQNGLFGWALSKAGFHVTRLSASVMRNHAGAASAASHLCLLVRCDNQEAPFLADVGFGGSMLEPIALVEGEYHQPPFRLGLRKLEDGYWRFWEQRGDGEFSFDFLAEPADETALSNKCGDLQNNPSSHFVLNLSVQQRTPVAHKVLRGKVFTVATASGATTKQLDSPQSLVDMLGAEFNLDVPEIAGQWPKIAARHAEIFGEGDGV